MIWWTEKNGDNNTEQDEKNYCQHGFCVRRADVQTWSFVLLMNFSNKLKLCAPKPARTQSPKTLAVILKDNVIMSKLTLFILTIISFPLFGQNEINGVVLDSLSNDPIPFATITYKDKLKTTSDFNGAFKLGQVFDSTIILKITVVGYYAKEFKVILPQDSLKLTLRPIPLDDNSSFIIWGKATDTLFFENGKTQRINYSGGDFEEFYRSGQIKFVSVNGSTRTWFENGQLKSQSILKNNHYRIETTWYSNGQKETEGTMSWSHNDKKNEGEWKKNNDWKYWTDNGKEKNNR